MSGIATVPQVLGYQGPSRPDTGIGMIERTESADPHIHVYLTPYRAVNAHHGSKGVGGSKKRGYSSGGYSQDNREKLRFSSSHDGIDGHLFDVIRPLLVG